MVDWYMAPLKKARNLPVILSKFRRGVLIFSFVSSFET